MDNNQNSNNMTNNNQVGNNYNNSTIATNNPNDPSNTNGLVDSVKTDYYNNDSYYNNSNYNINYSDTSYEEKENKNGIWWKILLVILIVLIIIILLLKFCVGGSKSDDEKYTALKAKICTAAETYVMNNPDVLDRTEPGKSATIKYKKLSDANLIEAQIVNPYYKWSIFGNNSEDKYYSLENSVRLTVSQDLSLSCELVDNSQDVTAPEIRLNGDKEVTFAIGTEFQDPMATATDDYDGDLSDKIVRSGNVDLTKAGTYELTYTVADSAGNTSSIKRTIIYEEYGDLKVTMGSILDNVTPMISLKGANPYCMVKGTKYVEPGATATDNVDGNLTDKIAVTNKVTGNLIGSFRVTYKVEDSSGNQAIAYRAVIVSTECSNEDNKNSNTNTAPVITLVGKNSVTVNVGTEYIDLGATAYDKEDGDITSRITTDTTQVNTNKAGVYKVLYRVTDSYGVTSNASRTVTVKTSVAGNPSVRFTEVKENITTLVGMGNDSLLNPPKAVNENGLAVNVTKYIEDYTTKEKVNAIDWNKEGEYRVIYTATHANGNVSQSKSIVVTIYSDTVTIEGKNAINVAKRTENCDLNEADLTKGGIEFKYKGQNAPIISLKNHEKKACTIGTYEINVTATPKNGIPSSKKITVYVVNGDSEPVNPNAPSQVIITKNTANSEDPYNGNGNFVGSEKTGITVEFKSTPAAGTKIAKYQWSSSCSTVEGELGTTSDTTGSLNWTKEGKKSICIRAVSTEGYEGLWSNPINLYIDKTGPSVVFTHTWADDKNDWHNSSELTLSYKGIDEASGVDHFEYTFDDVKAKKAEGKENEIITTEIVSNNLIVSENMEPLRPELFIFIRAIDKAGNKGPWVEKPAYANMDTIKPNTPTATVANDNTTKPTITANATDIENPTTKRFSGIGGFKFVMLDELNNVTEKISTATMVNKNDKLQGGKITFEMPMHAGDSKKYNVKVYAIDNAGNESTGYAELTVNVKGGKETTDISLKCPTNAYVNATDKVIVTTTPTDAAERDFTYLSSDNSIVTIDKNGNLSYKAIGESTITVRLIAKSATYEKTCTINVKEGTNQGSQKQSFDGGGAKQPSSTNKKIVYIIGVYGDEEKDGKAYAQAYEVPNDWKVGDSLTKEQLKNTYTYSSINKSNSSEYARILAMEEFISSVKYPSLMATKNEIEKSLGYAANLTYEEAYKMYEERLAEAKNYVGEAVTMKIGETLRKKIHYGTFTEFDVDAVKIATENFSTISKETVRNFNENQAKVYDAVANDIKSANLAVATSKTATAEAKKVASINYSNAMTMHSIHVPSCFVAGTKVVTKNGTKNIEDINNGDIVLSYNEKTGKNEYQKVEQLIIHENRKEQMLTINIGNDNIKVTTSHKFYKVNEKGTWIKAADLKVGDKLLNINGESVEISGITLYQDNVVVYNLEVANNHNYYVGDGYLVHNAK